MHRHALHLTLVVALLSWTTDSAVARLPGTLNIRNVTATNIHQTVAETPNNEKEVEFGDFDNDGDLDVVVAVAWSDFGAKRNKLYRNVAGEFNEISGAPFISGFSGSDVSRNAFFRDYDRDGWLDIIIVNDANTGGDGGRTKLYINKQVAGQFNRFDEEGLARLGPDTGGAACGGVSFDSNADGNIDLYVGNYPGPSQDTMYFNNISGFFADMTATHVPVDGDYTVDVATADLNGDGRTDLLLSNHGNNYLYYNNLGNAGSGLGDFNFPGSSQFLANASESENAMEPADFNNDGRIDFYWVNRFAVAQGSNRVYQNIGNDALNRAILAELPQTTLPPSVLSRIGAKATVADLNLDGRIDVIVMKDRNTATSDRPTILRNTSVNGGISFVDWTPANVMPDGQVHKGWHAAAFDADGDGWKDIFVGGWTNEHLFLNSDSVERTEAQVGGTISNLLNQDPLAVVGTVNDNPDRYALNGVLAGDMLSVILNADCADLTLRILRSDLTVIAESNRGGLGVEEALQIVVPVGAPPIIEVALNAVCGDADENGLIDLNDFDAWLDCAMGPEVDPGATCDLFDFDHDNDADFADFSDLQRAFTGPTGAASASYQLEILARD